MHKTYKVVGLLLVSLLVTVFCSVAAEQGTTGLADDTMLMFVGEAQPVVTVASRFPEAPTTAPALVTVVSREEIKRKGYQTLAALLADQPGFFVAVTGRGSVPYLRGLRDSILFLYDGVPMTTDVTKSFAPLDREISLATVASVEIVRGPGSVLWGPDAFAGVVNIVPLRGRQLEGGSAGIVAGNDGLAGATLTWGQTQNKGDAFLALSGLRESYHDPDYTSWLEDGQIVTRDVDPSEYGELVGTLNYNGWLHVSGRWSDFKRRYTLRNATEDISWGGEKKTPVNHIKVSASKVDGPSHYNFSSYVQETNYELRDADIEREQRNRVFHAEFLWDRRVFEHALLTAGASFRYNSVDGALVRDGFLPEFLPPDLPIFIPRIEQENFNTRLNSVFGQFRYQWGKSSWWVGARLDDHSQYETTLSYSLGFHVLLRDDLHFKATYGTAFRSPYSSQIYDDISFDPEAIRTASVQLSWQPGAGRLLELTLFQSSVDDHRVEDPYGGLSLPAQRDLFGLELFGQTPLSSTVSINAGLSVLDDSDEMDTFSVDFCFVRPDGSRVCVADEWLKPADQGPAWTARLGLDWQLGTDHTLAVSVRDSGPFDYSYKKNQVSGHYSQPLLVDFNYRLPGFFSGKDTLSLRVLNLFDKDYQQPGVYGPVDGPPLQVKFSWDYRF